MELWPFMPQVGITESLEWLTDVITCRSAEYRSALRLTPRQEQQLLFHLDSQQYSRAKSLAKLLMGDYFYLPFWPDITEVSFVSSNIITASTYGKHFFVGDKVVIWQSDTEYQIVTISSVSSTEIGTVETLTVPSVSSIVMPIRTVSFAQEFSVDRSNFAVVECTGRFISTVTEDMAAFSGISYPTFQTYPVITDKSFIGGGQREDYLREIEELDTRSGMIWREPITNTPMQRSTWTWKPNNFSDMWDLRIWLHQRYGRQKAFWVPSWGADVRVVENISSDDTIIYIEDINYRTTNPGSSYLMFSLTNGSLYFAKVTDATAGTEGREYLTLSAAAGFSSSVSRIDRVAYLTLSRFDSDRVEISHGHAGAATVSVPVVEVPIP